MQVRVVTVPVQLNHLIVIGEIITIEPQTYRTDTCIHVGNIINIKNNQVFSGRMYYKGYMKGEQLPKNFEWLNKPIIANKGTFNGNIRYIKRNGDSYLNLIKNSLGYGIKLEEFFERV